MVSQALVIGEDALTILDVQCEADGIPGTILSVTVKATIRANRDVENIRGWLTINGGIFSLIPKEFGGKSLGDLSAGQTKSFSITEPTAGQVIAGNARCGVHIEFREVNPTPQPTPQPDLVIQSIRSNKSTLAPGESFTLSATVKNRGDGRASSTTLRYYRSTDATISSRDTEVGTDSVSPLGANRTGDESITLTAPTSPGTYYYGACVDNVTDESATTNNCSTAVSVNVTAPPDLTVSLPRLRQATLAPGERFSLDATVTNSGKGPSAATYLRVYEDSDDYRRERQIDRQSVRAIAAGRSDSVSIQLEAPLEAGSYYYRVYIEPVTGETETDNNYSHWIGIDVLEPLVLESLQASKVSLTSGESFTLTATVKNSGDDRSRGHNCPVLSFQ